MAIEYTLLTDEEYKECKYLSILWLEEEDVAKTTPYTDNASGGYATIGAGFKIDSNWTEILNAFGFDTTANAIAKEKEYIAEIKALVGTNELFTSSQMEILIKRLNGKMFERFNYYKTNFGDETKRKTFTFKNTDEIIATFQIISQNHDTGPEGLSEWLGETSGNEYTLVPMSLERIALLSRKYNHVIGFQKGQPYPIGLKNAILNGDRAKLGTG
jgi:hypothetical protein